ncbi:hypothetical protein Q1695_003379 [Nippostrongylus brasiliensis]|nr:hypothetical protein Q1695_003379 [Nippostrongylus brasiliensis]
MAALNNDVTMSSSAMKISVTMIAIICMVLAAVTAVFFGCYFFLRFIHRALGSDERKDSDALPYSNVVIHSKRVYEIQAEEGCFTGPPDIHEPAEPSKSQSSDDHQSIGSNECSRQGSLKKPETGDLKAIRLEHECDDPRQIMRKKERKVHKDSVCAFLFRPGLEPRMI